MGKFVAIEIGNKVTKVLYGQDKKDDIVIRDYKLIENSDKIFNPDGDLNINEIFPMMKEILKSMKIRRAECFLTVGGESGIVRLREMPLVRLKEMEEMVRFEAEQFLPYNIEGFYIDFRVNQIKKIVEEDGSESDDVAEVMIVASPKEVIDEQVTLVDKLRLNIKRVDYYTDAIYCYFRKYILHENRNTLVVDLGSSGMKLTMFNGKQYFANIFSEVGINDLIHRFSEIYNCSIQDAKSKLINYETVEVQLEKKDEIHNKLDRLREKLQIKKAEMKSQNSLESEVSPELERIYEPIAYEVTKMMEFFKTRQFGMTVDEIYLIGGGSNIKDFRAYLEYYHNTEVKLITNEFHTESVKVSDYRLMVPAIGSLLKGGC